MFKYMKRNTKYPHSQLYEFEPDAGDKINYQRFAATSQDLDPAQLHYTNNIQVVRFGLKGYMRMKIVQCVDTMTVKLYVTFGRVDRFMYAIIEKGLNKKNSYLRITGVLEPSALIQDRNSGYFLNQLANSQSRSTACYNIVLNINLNIYTVLLVGYR